MSRSLPEWVAASDDAAIPPRVKLRVWARCEGRCAITGKKLRPGDAYQFDHIKALTNGGEHREANLQVVCSEAHKVKTRADVAERVKTDRIRKKHIGAWPAPVRKMQSRPFPARGER